MLKSATIKNFGPLPSGEYKFAPGLNVVVGENGLGKTQLIKLLYTLLKVQADSKELTKTALQKDCADKLVNVFRPDSLGRLVTRRQGHDRCELALSMKDPKQNLSISFATRSSSSVQVDCLPEKALVQSPAFLPTRELLTLCPWFGPLYDNYDVPFEESWRDTVSLLGNPALKGPRATIAAELLMPLEEAMGGKVVVDTASKRFYLQLPGEGKMEMPLVAEGMRKIAMLARLISTGTLLEQGYLFWDEPETNLNPRLIRKIAASIMSLCRQGIQVFIATHSYFLLKELDLLSRQQPVAQRYIGLSLDDARQVQCEQVDSLAELTCLVALDEELAQYDREMEISHDAAG
ncbi:TPA: AAA family ATPase [Pseudomonas aeruginosa]|uniref:AAA family ATPase n=1 Tax=Pseudomonas aeruginosa TaxID=287 RepID=A0A241XQ33_PSEAI|nr:AAA family ATPase [Pseudomonas aeruginosa]AMA35065.1 ATP-binding protein [Pseudomonas aeruginosa DHS01]AWE86022.1 AAA domain protein [Pseudomonas aeruginosa]EIU1611976.1 AAA family ATPase [Pseudomonas aeruginosa]EIU1617581.1 AAA family ATPase [Pseudomonas aeruginosa]EJB8385134.1 AAA family ATPase [Pseudomonas aeruginosa]